MSYQVKDILEFNRKSIFKAEALAWLQEHDLPIHPLLHARSALLSSKPSRYLLLAPAQSQQPLLPDHYQYTKATTS